MGNIGSTELLIIFVLALLLLGPKRLPEVGDALGRTLRRFRQASRELRDELDVRGDLDVRRDLDIRRDLESDAESTPKIAPAREAQARAAAEPPETTRAPEGPPEAAGAPEPSQAEAGPPAANESGTTPTEPSHESGSGRG